MCGIYCSKDKEMFERLRVHNSKRGVMNESIEEYVHNDIVYNIGHIQSPTSNSSNKHPAEFNGLHLWHNGIIKPTTLREFDKDPKAWDTLSLLEIIYQHGLDILSQIDGSFACILKLSDRLFVFRNEMAPLFINSDLDISSLKYSGMNPLEANIIFEITKLDSLNVYREFTTKNNPWVL